MKRVVEDYHLIVAEPFSNRLKFLFRSPIRRRPIVLFEIRTACGTAF